LLVPFLPLRIAAAKYQHALRVAASSPRCERRLPASVDQALNQSGVGGSVLREKALRGRPFPPYLTMAPPGPNSHRAAGHG